MAKVRAIEKGYYGDIVRSEGEEFVFSGPGTMPAWMERLDATDTAVPASVTTPASATAEQPATVTTPAKADDKPKGRGKGKGKAETVTAEPVEPVEPFGDAPQPEAAGEGNGIAEALGGPAPDWLPPQAVAE